MTKTLESCTSQLRTLIHFASGGQRPGWFEVPSDTDDMTLRSGVSKVLSWLRAMSMSKSTRELALTNQSWSEVVRCMAKSDSFILLGKDQDSVALATTLTDDEKISLCDIASEFRPRLMK